MFHCGGIPNIEVSIIVASMGGDHHESKMTKVGVKYQEKKLIIIDISRPSNSTKNLFKNLKR
jgi:hypothetical protein